MGCVNSKKTAPKTKPTNEKPKDEKRKVSEKTLVKDTDNERQSSLFITDPKAVTKGRVEDHYEIKKEIGRGTFSVVKEGVHRETKERVALKFIDKKYVDKEDLMLLAREIDIMKKVNHPNVLSLKEIFETSKQITLVMELVTGGELFFKIVDRGSYNERDAALIVRQIVSGVKYLHSLGIAHRDLKPENLLCSGEGEAMQIKIADFGLSKIFAGGQQLETSCGTPDYAAPEVLNGGQIYDKSVDLWSVGVITYVLLCGYPPFYASSQPALFEKIIKAQYDFPKAEWDYISDVAKDFVKTLLLLDPQKRMTADECLAHPFLAVERSAGATLNIENSLADYSARRRKERGITPVKDDSEDSD